MGIYTKKIINDDKNHIDFFNDGYDGEFKSIIFSNVDASADVVIDFYLIEQTGGDIDLNADFVLAQTNGAFAASPGVSTTVAVQAPLSTTGAAAAGSTNDNLLNERIYDNTGKFYGVCTTVSSTISIIFADGLYNSFVDNELLYVGKRTHILKSVKIPNGASLELDGFSVNNRTHKMYVRSADANGEIDVVIKT